MWTQVFHVLFRFRQLECIVPVVTISKSILSEQHQKYINSLVNTGRIPYPIRIPKNMSVGTLLVLFFSLEIARIHHTNNNNHRFRFSTRTFWILALTELCNSYTLSGALDLLLNTFLIFCGAKSLSFSAWHQWSGAQNRRRFVGDLDVKIPDFQSRVHKDNSKARLFLRFLFRVSECTLKFNWCRFLPEIRHQTNIWIWVFQE